MITDEDLRDMIFDEGMDYVLLARIDVDKIENEKTREIAKNAHEAMVALEKHLNMEEYNG